MMMFLDFNWIFKKNLFCGYKTVVVFLNTPDEKEIKKEEKLANKHLDQRIW